MGAGAGSGSGTYGFGKGVSVYRSKTDYSKPINSKTKSVTYSATVNDLLLDLAPASDIETNTATDPINAVRVRNDGYVSGLAIFAFTRYTAETTEGNTEYVHFLLAPNEEITIPATRAVIVDSSDQFDGTAAASAVPDANMYVASGCLLDEGVI